MKFIEVLQRAENDCSDSSNELDQNIPLVPAHGSMNLTFAKLSFRRVQENIESVKKLSSLNRNLSFVSLSTEALRKLTESIVSFQHFWDVVHFSTLNNGRCNSNSEKDDKIFTELQELRKVGTSLWVTYFSHSQFLEPFFQNANALPWVNKCIASIVYSLSLFLHELIEEEEQKGNAEHAPSVPVNKVFLRKCVVAGCSAAVVMIRTTLKYRMGLMMSLRVFTPPLQTMTFILNLENSLLPLTETEKKYLHLQSTQSTSPSHSCAVAKVLEVIQRSIRSFAFFYGEFIFEHMFSSSFLSHSRLHELIQNNSEDKSTAIRPVLWSFWMWLCGVYHATVGLPTSGEGGEDDSLDPFRMTAGQYLMAAAIYQFVIRLHRWLLNIPAPLAKNIQNREVLLLVLLIRLWRDILGTAIYRSIVSRILYKLLAASAVEKLPLAHDSSKVDEAASPQRKSVKESSSQQSQNVKNTNAFFAMIWAVPGLSPAELEQIRERNIVPWDPKFPRASSIQFVLGNAPIYITRHLCHRLRHRE